MLLQSLLVTTDATHMDFEPLTAALKLMSDVSNHLNEYLKLLESQKMLSDIYTRLVASKSELADHLIQPHRKLISHHSLVMYVDLLYNDQQRQV